MNKMKNRYVRGLILMVLFALPALLNAQERGKSMQLMGGGLTVSPAGAGIASYGIMNFYRNPASIAEAERLGFGFEYGSLDGDYYNPDIFLAIPSSYGVIGLAYRGFIGIPSTSDFSYGHGLTFGMAKDFTDRLMIGFGLNVFYGASDNTLVYIGPNIGTIYKLKGSKPGMGFGLYNPKIGFNLNFGYPFGGTDANFNSLGLGYSFQFFRHEIFTLGFCNDINAVKGYSAFPVKIGLETIFIESFALRLGGIVPVLDEYDYSDFYGGLGYIFKSDNFSGSINYNLTYSGEMGFSHHAGLVFEYGKLDREPPVTKIDPDKMFFSPNHDGINDYVVFKLGVEDKSRIKSWKLQVKDEKDIVVWDAKISERDTIEGLTFTGFFKRLVQKKTSMTVPDSIMWDGTDKNAKLLPDGKYNYSFTVTDERDNISELKKGTVILDNTSPDVKLTSADNLFSPNGDNQKDTLVIEQKIVTAPSDKWEAGFKDVQGKTVKSYSWDGNNVPGKLIWDGKDDSGSDAPEGLYFYFVKSTDEAGNSTSAEIKEITLTRSFETADITISSEYFSYLKNSDIQFFPRLSNTSGLKTWKIEILNGAKKPVKEITGENTLPPSVKWDCLDKNGKKLDDGEYFFWLSTVFASGNTPSSFEKKLIIDSTPPKLSISHSPDLFSPDGDGENDVLTIKSESEDEFGIKEWKFTIYSPSGEVFKSFSGTGLSPAELMWDGLSKDGELVESAADYSIELEAVDFAGNLAKTGPRIIQVDILVVVTERGLKMNISNIEFAFGQADIKPKGRKILDRVSVILNKYEKYDVIIEGHTDSIGSDEYNLKLSERRALSVFDYLVKKGINSGRLQSIGMGESVPFKENTTEDNRRRNRRVEFILVKKSDSPK